MRGLRRRILARAPPVPAEQPSQAFDVFAHPGPRVVTRVGAVLERLIDEAERLGPATNSPSQRCPLP